MEVGGVLTRRRKVFLFYLKLHYGKGEAVDNARLLLTQPVDPNSESCDRVSHAEKRTCTSIWFCFSFFFLPFFFFFLYFYIVLTIALQGCPMESHGSLFLCHVWGNFSSSWCSSRLLRESGWCPVKLEEGKCQLKIDFRNPHKFLRKEEVKFTRGLNMSRVLCDSDLLLAATRERNEWGTP